MKPSRPNLNALILPAKSGPAGVVVRCWRTLSGGSRVRDPERRTLIACSGGADSSALALCLAAASNHLVIAHVLHDLRPEHEARADLEAVRALAAGLSLPFACASVTCRSEPGNSEAIARRERYAALAALAREHACPFVVTAHHADDQLETLLMRFIRGAGPRGLAGIAPRRRVAPGLTLIRPMLEITRAEAEAICRAAGVVWAEDATNADRSRLRAALRHGVIPSLRAIAPSIATTAGRVARVQREVARAIEGAADELMSRAATECDGGVRMRRSEIAAAPRSVAEAAIRGAIARIASLTDAPASSALEKLVGAIRGRSGEPRVYQFRGVAVELSREWICIRAAEGRP